MLELSFLRATDDLSTPAVVEVAPEVVDKFENFEILGNII